MNGAPHHPMAPALQVSEWLNTDSPISLADLRGKVVVIEAFQMLCPGCVSHGLPQAAAIAETFSPEQVVVLGLHCVFEHHDVMTPQALRAFLHEYRIGFPVAVDTPADKGAGPIPKTMQAYELQGTPSLLVIDRAGQLRLNHFGRMSDMAVGATIASLLHETVTIGETSNSSGKPDGGQACTEDQCSL